MMMMMMIIVNINCVGVNNRKAIHIRALISNSHNKTNKCTNV